MELSEERLERISDLIYEAGMLSQTPRTGWAFLGSHAESVAEHSFRCAVLGYVLARLAHCDASKVVLLCLFHDLHEARTGDLNYVYHRYAKLHEREALEDALEGTGMEEILTLFETFCAKESLEARLANDADQLDLIANLACELKKGNEFARDWLESALARLTTEQAREVAEALLKTDPNHWWYGRVEKSYWIHHHSPEGA